MAAVCLDFLATNSTKARSSMTADYRVRMLAAIETLLGVNLIATDPKTNQPFYASAALKKAAKRLRAMNRE
jgi:hypothetical protein